MPTNSERAERGYRALLKHTDGRLHASDIRTSIIDLVTDLLHTADEYGEDSDGILLLARFHYDDERLEATNADAR